MFSHTTNHAYDLFRFFTLIQKINISLKDVNYLRDFLKKPPFQTLAPWKKNPMFLSCP